MFEDYVFCKLYIYLVQIKHFEKMKVSLSNEIQFVNGVLISCANLPFPHQNTVELQWLEHLWNYGNMFETGWLELKSINHGARSGGSYRYIFDFP